jgi:hypothetical protein
MQSKTTRLVRIVRAGNNCPTTAIGGVVPKSDKSMVPRAKEIRQQTAEQLCGQFSLGAV